MEVLMEQGAYVNCRSGDGLTPLMYAARYGHLAACRLLVGHHADRYARDPNGRMAADLAESAGHTVLAQTLRDPGRFNVGPMPGFDKGLPALDGQRLVLDTREGSPRDDGRVVDKTQREGEPPKPWVPERSRPDNATSSGSDPSSDLAQSGESTPPRALEEASPPSEPSGIDSDDAWWEKIELGRFQERFEPFVLIGVEGDFAKLQVMGNPGEGDRLLAIEPGSVIPGTDYTLLAVHQSTGLLDSGEPGERARMEVSHGAADGQERRSFRVGERVRHAATHLVVKVTPSGKAFAARVGDRFHVQGLDQSYTVVSVDPHRLGLKNERSGRVISRERWDS
jgi:hypothetical protein